MSCTMDDVGNRTQRVDQAGTHTYAYDDLYRLTSVTYPDPATTTYAYDAFRVTLVTRPASSLVAYLWNDNGNQTNRGADTFAWDYEDRMLLDSDIEVIIFIATLTAVQLLTRNMLAGSLVRRRAEREGREPSVGDWRLVRRAQWLTLAISICGFVAVLVRLF